MTEHDQLKAALDLIRYPLGIVSCSEALKRGKIISCPIGYCAIGGQSFFPGGRGHADQNLPFGGVMYLGHYFDKISGFLRSVRQGYEENLTWRKIRAGVFKSLPEDRIWFTNYFMGVSEGERNIGELERTSGFSDYEADCWNFLCLQVSLQKPKIIAILGKNVVRPLGAFNRLDFPDWLLREGDPYGPLRMIVRDVSFHFDGRETRTKVVAVYHPSYGRDDGKLLEVERDAEFIASQLPTDHLSRASRR
jgi:hypothetical protein